VVGGPLPDPDTPAAPRFLPEYDNALLSHADRTRVIAHAERELVFTRGAFLVDGFVRGRWHVVRRRQGVTLVVEPFAPLAGRERTALGDEADRLVAFVAGEAPARDVRFEPAG